MYSFREGAYDRLIRQLLGTIRLSGNVLLRRFGQHLVLLREVARSRTGRLRGNAGRRQSERILQEVSHDCGILRRVRLCECNQKLARAITNLTPDPQCGAQGIFWFLQERMQDSIAQANAHS